MVIIIAVKQIESDAENKKKKTFNYQIFQFKIDY